MISNDDEESKNTNNSQLIENDRIDMTQSRGRNHKKQRDHRGIRGNSAHLSRADSGLFQDDDLEIGDMGGDRTPHTIKTQ